MTEIRPVWELAGISIYDYKALSWREKRKLLKKYGFISGKKDKTPISERVDQMRFDQAGAQKAALEEDYGKNIWPRSNQK